MTYSELLHSVSFKEIVPYLKRYHRTERLFDYKQHYDMLKQLTPLEAKEEDDTYKTVKIDKYDDPPCTPPLLYAWPLEGQIWEEALAKEIEVPGNIETSPAEVAAACIWASSFYGFTKADKDDIFNSWHEEIQAKKLKLYKKKYAGCIPSIKDLMKIKSTMRKRVKRSMRYHRKRNRYSQEDKVLDTTPSNWRYWKRWVINDEYQRIVVGNCDFVEYLHMDDSYVSPPSPDVLCKALLSSPEVYMDTIYTFTSNPSERVEYIRDMIETWHAVKKGNYKNVILCFTTAKTFPLKMREFNALKPLFVNDSQTLKWCLKQKESMGEEMRIDFVYYN